METHSYAHQMIATAARVLTVVMLIVSAAASAADTADAARAAERAINEYVLRTEIIMSCHLIQTDADKAYFESGEAIGKAAFEQLWEYLNAIDPAQNADNGDKADRMMEQIIVGAEQQAEQLFQEKGCAALEDELKTLQWAP